MPSIAEATRARRGRRRRRIAAGVGLLLTGALLVAVGAAGAASAETIRNGAVVGGLAVLVCIVMLADRAPLGETERNVAAVGALFGLAGVFLFWAVTPGETGSASGALFASIIYLAGVVVLGAAVLAAVTSPSPAVERLSAESVTWERGEPSSTVGSVENDATPDGGAPDDEPSVSPNEDQ